MSISKKNYYKKLLMHTIITTLSVFFVNSCISLQLTQNETSSIFSGKDTQGIEEIIKKVENPTEKWRIDANKRIDKYRKAQLTIKVIDAKTKKAIPNASVSVVQIKHSFRFGGIINTSQYIKNKKKYLQLFNDMGFNASGFNNAFKYKLRRWFENRPPELIKWLRKNHIFLRGHCIIWPGDQTGNHLPKELASLTQEYSENPSDNLKNEINDYTFKMIKTWAKKWDVDEWDVINEPRANHLIQDILGNKIERETEWFKLTKENMQHPQGLLYLNENRIISDPVKKEKVISKKVQIYYDNVKALLENNAPLSALGFQTRFARTLPAELMYKRLCVFNEFNLPIAATEFEMKQSIGTEFDKALMTERVMTIYFSHPLVNGIYAWTILNNPPSKKKKEPQNQNRGLINPDYTPSLRAKTWLYLTKNKWHTDETLTSNKNGKVSLRAFKGKYKIKVKANNKEKEINLDLEKNKKITIEIPSSN